jgi:hypothetical protein
MADIGTNSSLRYELRCRLVDRDKPIDSATHSVVLRAKNDRDAKVEVQLFVDANWPDGTAIEVVELTRVIEITSTVREKLSFP